MIINIDYREKKLIEILQNLLLLQTDYSDKTESIKLNIDNLEIGDIIISKETDDDSAPEILLIIERKSVSDLAASLRDGRYNEQSARLNHHPLHNHNIIYLIEGDIRSYKPPSKVRNPISPSALYSTLISLLYYKGFSVLRTFNVSETAEMLLRITDKIKRESCVKTSSKTYPKPPFYTKYGGSTTNSAVESNDNSSIIKGLSMKKSDNITADNIGILMLCQIPGIGESVATIIMNEYETIGDLINDLRNDKNCLDNISYQSGNNTRKIGKKTTEKLLNFLVKNE